jgi:hypothetical protein
VRTAALAMRPGWRGHLSERRQLFAIEVEHEQPKRRAQVGVVALEINSTNDGTYCGALHYRNLLQRDPELFL